MLVRKRFDEMQYRGRSIGFQAIMVGSDCDTCWDKGSGHIGCSLRFWIVSAPCCEGDRRCIYVKSMDPGILRSFSRSLVDAEVLCREPFTHSAREKPFQAVSPTGFYIRRVRGFFEIAPLTSAGLGCPKPETTTRSIFRKLSLTYLASPPNPLYFLLTTHPSTS